jgi:hypothetical protein
VLDPPCIKAISFIIKNRDTLRSLTFMQRNLWGLLPKPFILGHRTNILRSTTSFTTLVDRTPSRTLPKLTKPSLPFLHATRNIMTDQEQPWYAAYPQAKSSPEAISRSDVLRLLKQSNKAIVLVDLRRTDYEVRRYVHLHSCIHGQSCVCMFIRIAGRNHNDFNQPPGPKPLPDHPIAVRNFPRGWCTAGHLVLWSVSLDMRPIAAPSLHTLIQRLKLEIDLEPGSSRGRGTRAAAWFADHLQSVPDTTMKSLVLEGGIKGWVSEKGEHLEYVQEYDASKW